MPVELTEVARPYAEAAHKHAVEAGGDATQQWQDMLESLAALMEDEGVQAMLSDPRVSPAKARQALASLLEGVSSANGDQGGKFDNFVHQLHEHDRLEAAEEVSRRYRELRRMSEGEVDVEIRSAFELDKGRVGKIAEKLKSKLGARKVNTTVSLDPDLGGGVIVVMGNDVIDGSVKTELDRMRVSLRKA